MLLMLWTSAKLTSTHGSGKAGDDHRLLPANSLYWQLGRGSDQ